MYDGNIQTFSWRAIIDEKPLLICYCQCLSYSTCPTSNKNRKVLLKMHEHIEDIAFIIDFYLLSNCSSYQCFVSFGKHFSITSSHFDTCLNVEVAIPNSVFDRNNIYIIRSTPLMLKLMRHVKSVFFFNREKEIQ